MEGGTGNDIVIGGTAGDSLFGDDANPNAGDSDLILGDQALVERTPLDGSTSILDLLTLPAPDFTFTSINTDASGGAGADTIHGDGGQDIILGQQGIDDLFGDGGDDDIIGGHNVVDGFDETDDIDGGAGNDAIAGDNVTILRNIASVSDIDQHTGQLLRTLSDSQIYSDQGEAQLDSMPQVNTDGTVNPAGHETAQRYINILNHSDTPDTNTFGADNIAGGANDDVIFGQLGDDSIQGDGASTEVVAASRVAGSSLIVDPSVEAPTDGEDYVEGNGGSDVIFGNLGQDGIIGGSSDIFGLGASSDLRPDIEDLLFGGAGLRIGRDDLGDLSDEGHGSDADTIVGDNANVFRLVDTARDASGRTQYLTFTYDDYSTVADIIPQVPVLLDYTPGGANAADVGEGDEIHGEASDDSIYGQVGQDVLFGDAQDDDIIGGYDNDWVSGGAGKDGIVGDDGRVLTSRNGQTETLYGLTQANSQESIGLPGPFTGAVVDKLGRVLSEF